MASTGDRAALEDLMARYVLGDLGRGEAKAFERLLEGHPEWAEEVLSLRRAARLVPYAAAAAPPPELRARVLRAALAADRPKPVRPDFFFAWRLAGSFAVVLLIIVGLDDYALRRELDLWKDATSTLQQPNVVLPFSLRGTGISVGMAGSVLLDLDAERAALVVRGLSTLPGDQVYRLWAEVGDKTVPCGEFNTGVEGSVVIQFPIPVDAYTAPISRLVVTREPAAGLPQPVGPVVMSSS